jgi:hypothetical protein
MPLIERAIWATLQTIVQPRPVSLSEDREVQAGSTARCRTTKVSKTGRSNRTTPTTRDFERRSHANRHCSDRSGTSIQSRRSRSISRGIPVRAMVEDMAACKQDCRELKKKRASTIVRHFDETVEEKTIRSVSLMLKCRLILLRCAFPGNPTLVIMADTGMLRFRNLSASRDRC